MQTATRPSHVWAIAASVLAHLGVLLAALLLRPTLIIPEEPGGPPQAIIPLLMLPRTPAPLPGHGLRPVAIQLHRRPQRSMPDDTPVAPITLPPPKPVEAPAAVQAPAASKLSPPPAAPPDAVRATLKATLGCTENRMALMGHEERAGCLERLGRGAHEAAYFAPALSSDKRALLEDAGAEKMARKLAGEHPFAGDGPSAGRAEPQDYSGEPDVAINAVPAHSHPPSKRAAKVLAPLRP